MAVPVVFLTNSPHESSDEEYSDSEISLTSEDESMEEELPETENTNGGSLSSLSTLEREVTESEPNGAENEFWVQFPYLKDLLKVVVRERHQDLISENDAFKIIKRIGDEKAKELNEAWKALCTEQLELCLKQQGLCIQILKLFASAMKSGNR